MRERIGWWKEMSSGSDSKACSE